MILDGLGKHFGYIDESKNPDIDDIMTNYITPGHAKLFAQWNTDSNVVSTNFLINYIYRPGSDFFLVFNQIYDTGNDNVRLEDATVVAKMTKRLKIAD